MAAARRPTQPQKRLFHREPYPYTTSYIVLDKSRPLSASAILSLSASPPIWLLLYFGFNLALTLFNKIILVQFPFPYTLTAVHAFWGTIGDSGEGFADLAIWSVHSFALFQNSG